MEYYSNVVEEKSVGNFDPLTIEEFDNSHPRAVMMVRRGNGIPYPINVKSVMDIITRGNNQDPFTREVYSENVRQRAELYYKAIKEFPVYKLNSEDLYKRWADTLFIPINPLSPKDNLSRERTRLEARCFLQIEDLVDFFKPFFGNGSNMNREEAVRYLKETGLSWILRNSSRKDTEYDKYYALTTNNPKVMVPHYLICHKIGEGFFVSEKFFPSIIDCLEFLLKAVINL